MLLTAATTTSSVVYISNAWCGIPKCQTKKHINLYNVEFMFIPRRKLFLSSVAAVQCIIHNLFSVHHSIFLAICAFLARVVFLLFCKSRRGFLASSNKCTLNFHIQAERIRHGRRRGRSTRYLGRPLFSV